MVEECRCWRRSKRHVSDNPTRVKRESRRGCAAFPFADRAIPLHSSPACSGGVDLPHVAASHIVCFCMLGRVRCFPSIIEHPILQEPYRPSVGVPRDVGCCALVVFAAYFFSVQFSIRHIPPQAQRRRKVLFYIAWTKKFKTA